MEAHLMVMDDNGTWIPARASWFANTAVNTGDDAEPVNIVAPTIHGGIDVGSVLGVSKGQWTGKPAPTFAYQWKADGSNISGATSSSYTVVAGDAGKVITCDVKATNTGGDTTATSNGIGPIVVAPSNSAAPSISGTVANGETLTASTGTWAGSPTPTYAYQWLRDDVEIPFAVNSTYVLTDDDVGSVIKVKVTATNGSGSASATSSGTAKVGKPINTAVPEITGTATEGEELSASDGTWTADPDPAFTYQWNADDVAIDGATEATYTLTTDDVGAVTTVTVTATNANGSTSATSAGTSEVAAAGG